MASGGGNNKKREKWEGDGDRISNFPDSILLEILCRLPLTEGSINTADASNVLPAFSCKCLIVNLEKDTYYAYPGVKILLQSSSMVEKLVVLNFKEYGDGGNRQKIVYQPRTAFNSSMHNLKIIHVHGLHNSLENLYILEFLLKHATALQEIVVHEIQSRKTLNKLIFAKKLLDLPKSSPAAAVRLPVDVDEAELAWL